VLAGAGVEMWEWLQTGAEHLARLLDIAPGLANR
jgi:hypothetical protein